MRGAWKKLFFLVLIFSGGCLDPYSPPVGEVDVDILVVDGFLDTNAGTATVNLSRAVPLSSATESEPEPMATVTLYDDNGKAFPMQEERTGTHNVSGVPIEVTAKYRIHIRTQSGSEYQSDLMEVYETPPIDSVTWVTDDDHLTIRVNTHDFSNRTKHFKWSYEETWAYHAAVLSQYKVVGTQFVDRQPEDMIFYCWKTQPSTNIIIGSTDRLSDNIISQAPINYLSKGSQELSMKYSILVAQRGLSEEEYNYLDQLRKTTESVGGLFDPQPSQVPGNIKRMNTASPLAIGFFGVGSIVKQRIFIDVPDLPSDFRLSYPRAGCYPPDTVCVLQSNLIKVCSLTQNDLNEATMLGSAIYSGISLVGITLTTPPCADCRLDGGVLQKPDFWP